MRIDILVEGIRTKGVMTNHNNKNVLKSVKKPFFHTISGFTKTEYTAVLYRSEKPLDISGIDKIHIKSDCIDEGIVKRPKTTYLKT